MTKQLTRSKYKFITGLSSTELDFYFNECSRRGVHRWVLLTIKSDNSVELKCEYCGVLGRAKKVRLQRVSPLVRRTINQLADGKSLADCKKTVR